jgi:hypothetical protein
MQVKQLHKLDLPVTIGVTNSLNVIAGAHSNTREKDDHGEFKENQSGG